MNKSLTVAFLGALVPDDAKYHNRAFRRSGIMVQAGIVKGLSKLNIEHIVYSLRPVPSFPSYKKIFYRRENILYAKQSKLILVPFINLLFLKTITAAFYEFFALINWALKNIGKNRVILVYNTYTPPLPIVFLVGKITNSKVVAILYDLGMPPKQLNLNKTKTFIYRNVEFFAKLIIPKIAGRIVINENIAKDYAPNKHYLLVDGGISDEIQNRLFELKTKPKRVITQFLLAGSISPINGTRLIGDALSLNTNPNIRIIFAGNGRDEEYVKQLALKDKRVEYRGMLTLDELFELYKDVDVLLNLRVTDEADQYLFPSKILEYLTIGKNVVTTNVGHLKNEYGDFCSIIDKPNSQTLSNVFNDIHNKTNEVLIENGNKSRKFMIETHTWDIQTKKIIDYIIQNCLQ